MKRRGVSEIISAIILIMIVSVAGTYLFSYSTNYIQKQSDQYIRETQLDTRQSQERFTVSAVWWSGTDNFLNITVYNYGQNDIQISDIYIDGIRVNSYNFGKDTLLQTEKLLQVGFTSPIAVIDGTEYKITIVSDKGVTEFVYWEA